jgi:hypothetical protein
MKKATLIVAFALVLIFALTASAFATTGKFYKGGVDYYTWLNPTGSPTPGTAWVASGLSGLGDNPTNPGVHANYLATTAKCGICHSVHRAAGDGQKLLPAADSTCAGCHTGSTAITAKIVTWAPVDLNWVPSYDASGTLTTYPMPSYDLEPFSRYGCATRRCHATNPHGANSSKYKIFAAKLLFNNSPAQDDAEYPELVALHGNGTYGGLDAMYNNLGATDAAVARFDAANADIRAFPLTGLITINNATPNPAQVHALVAGLTCGRPSNPATGEDECHAEAAYAIVTRNIKENRNHATKISGNDNSLPAWPNQANGGSNNYFRTDNTGGEATGFGGNDHRDSKTGHVAGSFGADASLTAYAPIAGCTSCHDQTDAANTVAGNFTFPHGQTATGDTNLYLPDGATMATGLRVRIWAGYSGSTVDTLTTFSDNYANQKAFDGQCLKCHRTFDGEETVGIGITQ